MTYRHTDKEKGFTLIELLVVVAIIGLLSTIVLSSIGTAQARSRNAKRVSIVKQYMNALELYRNDKGGYPYDSITANTDYCLGETGTNVCYGNSKSGDATLNSNLATYIPGPPPMKETISSSGVDWHGLIYQCLNISSTKCTNYQLRWVGETLTPFCGPGIGGTSIGNNKVCTVTLN